jgi:hypothetical protein
MRRVLEGLGIERNRAFGGPAAIPNEGHLPRIPLDGGMVLTLLSPGAQQLAALRCTWSSALRKAGLDPDAPSADELNERARRKGVEIPRSLSSTAMRTLAGARFVRDRARANGSTIAVLAEYERTQLSPRGRCVLRSPHGVGRTPVRGAGFDPSLGRCVQAPPSRQSTECECRHASSRVVACLPVLDRWISVRPS